MVTNEKKRTRRRKKNTKSYCNIYSVQSEINGMNIDGGNMADDTLNTSQRTEYLPIFT